MLMAIMDGMTLTGIGFLLVVASLLGGVICWCYAMWNEGE